MYWILNRPHFNFFFSFEYYYLSIRKVHLIHSYVCNYYCRIKLKRYKKLNFNNQWCHLHWNINTHISSEAVNMWHKQASKNLFLVHMRVRVYFLIFSKYFFGFFPYFSRFAFLYLHRRDRECSVDCIPVEALKQLSCFLMGNLLNRSNRMDWFKRSSHQWNCYPSSEINAKWNAGCSWIIEGSIS